MERFQVMYDLLDTTGTFICHADYREIHYIKVNLDKIFGKKNFLNEIIWAYDFGARQTKKWATKHDNLLIYTKSKNYTFNYDEIDRVPYMTKGGLVSKEKLERGKTLTDVWWNTIVPTNSEERVGYPTQKPLKITERLVKVHSNENDNCLDFFAGSGTFGIACLKHNRSATLIDSNEDAVKIIKKRIDSLLTIE